MRTIKFRVWDKGKKKYIPNDVWALLPDGEPSFGVMINDWENYQVGEYFYPHAQLLEQFTGLLDKDGVEVFEGDYDEEGNMVDYCQTCLGYQFFQIDIPTRHILFCHNCDGNFMIQDYLSEFKVKSNIHDTPPEFIPM